MRRAKGRMLRKKISESHKIASLSKESLILFFMIIPHLNSFGKMNGSPHYIKGEVVPLLDYFTIPLIEKCLTEISAKTNIKWFKNNGLYWLHSLNWDEHQDLETNKKGDDSLPSFSELDDNSTSSRRVVDDNSTITLENHSEVKVEVEVKDKHKGDSAAIEEIITDLNEKTRKHYKTTNATKTLIRARFLEGFTLEDFRKVHETMSAKWKGDPKMDRFLRPATLYQASKFEGYLNERVSLSEQGKISTLAEKNLKVFENFKGV